MPSPRGRWLRRVSLIVVVGTCFQLPSCGLGDALSYVGKINPCGTILNCDPVTYEFIRSGYDGPGADPQVDPHCTYPPYCADDPFVSTVQTGQQ